MDYIIEIIALLHQNRKKPSNFCRRCQSIVVCALFLTNSTILPTHNDFLSTLMNCCNEKYSKDVQISCAAGQTQDIFNNGSF